MANQSFSDDSELFVKVVLYKSIFVNIAQFRKPVKKRDLIAKRCQHFNKNCHQKNYSFRICCENNAKDTTILKLEPSLIELRQDLRRIESFNCEFGHDKVNVVGYQFPGSELKISNLYVEFGEACVEKAKTHATELTQLMKHDKDILQLGDSLAPDSNIVRQRNIAVNEIITCIQQSPNIKVDRVVISGSTGRNTNICQQFDYDLVLFVNGSQPSYQETVIKEILRIVNAKHGLVPSFDYSTTPFSIKLTNWRGTDMDILCTPNLSSDPELQCDRAVAIMRKLTPKQRRYWLSSVSEKAVDFMKRLDVSANRLARVIKYMVLGWAFAERVFSKSYAMELLAVHASRNMISIGVSIAKFLEQVRDVDNIRVSFADNDRMSLDPHLMDPVNPFNNLYQYLSPHKADFKQFAKETLSVMKAGLFPFQFRVSEMLKDSAGRLVANWGSWVAGIQRNVDLEECTPIEDNCVRDLSRAEWVAIYALYSFIVMNVYNSVGQFLKVATDSVDNFNNKIAGLPKPDWQPSSMPKGEIVVNVILPGPSSGGNASKYDKVFVSFNLNNRNPRISGERNHASIQ